ncbi:uncharacterized protein LOC130984974 isoform X4 [Salvia miltiorrhiza]|uniref:uncharacterized protein LOC130984974 isoform X4 n=1 Tax=Salvia miltiorrhiza TaxID=226208 RepID=UPI0025AD8810|nr:uncharacterized protein LOC130984974 isoform X4 [Salvia miltiorrhiza]
MQQQLKSQIQSQPGQLENQLGLQQQSNTCADSSSPMGSATPVDWPKEYRKMLEQRQVLQQQYMLRLQQQQQQYMQPLIQLPPQPQSLIQQSLNHQLQQQQQQVYMHLIWQQQQVMLQQQQKLMLQKPLIQQQQQQQPMLQKPVIQLQQQTSKQPSIQQQQQTSKQLPIQQQQTSKQQNMLKQPLIQQDKLFERLPGQKMMPTSTYVLIICVMLLFSVGKSSFLRLFLFLSRHFFGDYSISLASYIADDAPLCWVY